MLVFAVLTGGLTGWGATRLAAYVPVWTGHLAARDESIPARVGVLAALLLAAVFAARVVSLPGAPAVDLLGWVLVAAFLVLVAVIDLRNRVVPNALIYPALLAVVAGHALAGWLPLAEVLVGGGFAFGIFYAVARLRPDLGGGDVKLAALLGFAFGFPGILWVLLAGTGAGGVFALVMLAAGRRGLTFAYAPFLCAGALLVLAAGLPQPL